MKWIFTLKYNNGINNIIKLIILCVNTKVMDTNAVFEHFSY